jgi:deoxyribodipyrimidine photo-lyase
MIEPSRIKNLNGNPADGKGHVIYWMQASQREEYNHALEYAIYKANEFNKPMYVYFGLTPDYPGAGLRHYYFMLEGLRETAAALKKRGIRLVAEKAEPDKGIIKAAANACLVVTDRGYTRIQKKWRSNAAGRIKCLLTQVESDVIIPVESASPKEEYAAATIRSKILGQLLPYLKPVKKGVLRNRTCAARGIDLKDVEGVLRGFDCDKSIGKAAGFAGGTSKARTLLKKFLGKDVKRYQMDHSDPALNCESDLSPYLHFGQISPLYAALEALKTGEKINGPFLEQLIIRRELAVNFVNYDPDYDSIACLPNWAKLTLTDHENDKREFVYSMDELEKAATHDPYWNAAQTQMARTGKMHNYMRMYWGKKVIEWSKTLEKAYKTLIYLNDKYELDGRDPNGYAGIAWCFGKHDRAWTERAIFGKIRYMNAKGLERKFDMNKYLDQVIEIVDR